MGASGMKLFERLAIATVIGVFALIVMGGVVRVSGSGLGCPDWPLCQGRAVPPLERAALIEYSHRLLVSIVSLLVLATAVLAWRRYRGDPWVVAPATIALALLLVQAGLGAVAVLGDLDPAVVTAHLGLALALLAGTLATAAGALWPRAGLGPRGRGRVPPLLLAAAGSVYGVMLLGAYIGTSGAGLACLDWPLCHGRVIPAGGWPWPMYVHFSHRALAAAAAVLVLAVLAQAWLGRHRQPDRLKLAALAAALILLQVLLGALNIWLRTPPALVVLHLANGSLTWVTLVAMTVLPFQRPREVLRPARGRAPLAMGSY